MEAIEAMQVRSLIGLAIYVVVVVLAHLLRWKRFSHLDWLALLTGMVLAEGARVWLGWDGFWSGPVVTGACVAAMYFLLGPLGRRFPPGRPRAGAGPRPAEQAGRARVRSRQGGRW